MSEPEQETHLSEPAPEEPERIKELERADAAAVLDDDLDDEPGCPFCGLAECGHHPGGPA